ncbi:MAG: hypothetical protein AB1757_17395 [Acidobacteriota bacterium]
MINGTERLRFDHVKVTDETDSECLIEVGLTFTSRAIQKTGNSSKEAMQQLKVVASLTLDAVKEAVENRFNCRLGDLDHVHALGKNLIALLVDIDFENKQVQVFGSCPITTNELDATAKAALNATNRFVELAMRK